MWNACVIFPNGSARMDTMEKNPALDQTSPTGKFFQAGKTYPAPGASDVVIFPVRCTPDAFRAANLIPSRWFRSAWQYLTMDALDEPVCNGSLAAEGVHTVHDRVVWTIRKLGGFVRQDGTFVAVEDLDGAHGAAIAKAAFYEEQHALEAQLIPTEMLLRFDGEGNLIETKTLL